MMKVGIIGGGQIAGVHGPLILRQPDVELVGIVDTDISRARALAGELGKGRAYSDSEIMIREEKPDVVHVPNAFEVGGGG
jgi:predicted dehydrogenase